MKHLIVCGDSFMSPRISHPKKHFVEIFADKLGYNLISYAKSGFSNGGIVIQLETAIKHKPNLILLNLTNSDRIEFRIDHDKPKNYKHPFTLEHIGTCAGRMNELSDSFYNNINPIIASENINSLLHDQQMTESFHNAMRKKYSDWDNKIIAIRGYFEYIYDENWKNIIDQMIMHTILYKLYRSDIPYIIVHDWLGLTTNITYKPDWLTQKHIVHELVDQIRYTMAPPHDNDPGFHLTYEGSEAVANILIEHYNRYF